MSTEDCEWHVYTNHTFEQVSCDSPLPAEPTAPRKKCKTYEARYRLPKTYRCLTCGKDFTTSGHLTRHRRVHTGEKPFICPICGMRFSRQDNCNQHVKTHAKDKPTTKQIEEVKLEQETTMSECASIASLATSSFATPSEAPSLIYDGSVAGTEDSFDTSEEFMREQDCFSWSAGIAFAGDVSEDDFALDEQL